MLVVLLQIAAWNNLEHTLGVIATVGGILAALLSIFIGNKLYKMKEEIMKSVDARHNELRKDIELNKTEVLRDIAVIKRELEDKMITKEVLALHFSVFSAKMELLLSQHPKPIASSSNESTSG